MGLDEIEASLADSLGHKNMTKLLMQISFGVMISYIIFTFLYSQFFRVRAWVRRSPPPPPHPQRLTGRRGGQLTGIPAEPKHKKKKARSD